MRVRLTVLALALLLNGCNCRIPVSVSGTLDNGITFSLRESREIAYAGVMMRDAEGRWEEIWRIEGEDKIGAVQYGEATPSLATAIDAKGLSMNQLYAFYIQDDDFWGPCVGWVTFVLTEDGVAEECETDQCIGKYR